jgi:hypothetical protein
MLPSRGDLEPVLLEIWLENFYFALRHLAACIECYTDTVEEHLDKALAEIWEARDLLQAYNRRQREALQANNRRQPARTKK